MIEKIKQLKISNQASTEPSSTALAQAGLLALFLPCQPSLSRLLKKWFQTLHSELTAAGTAEKLPQKKRLISLPFSSFQPEFSGTCAQQI